MTEFNIQQKQFIQEYKTSHHLENKSDEQIMLFIQKDMQTNGVVYPGFENLVKPQNKPAYTGQIFGNSTTSNDMAGVTIEHGGTTTATKEPEKEITTDENGNEVAVVKNGHEVVEATVSQTDSNGNKIETVVSYENGKPVKQIKKQNGNISSVTKFKYNEPTENMPFPSVTVETIDGGKNKIITTALETDKYGNVDQEDFISRKTISRDGTETTVIIGSEYIKEDKVKIDGKKVSTLYNGTNLADFDSHKLHRVAQETEVDGVKRYAEYDGKGNTKTTVQNGESPALIAQKFKVKEQALIRLNPQKGKNAITQVGADILIPGEFNADSYPMRVRKSKEESLNKYSQFEARRLTKEINTEDVQNTKLSKSYNNVYELAKDNLIKSGVKNPSNQQVNDEANKLILLNGKNVNLKAGTSIKVAKSLTNSKQASELTKYGFQASAENRIFFQKFNALNPQQKQNVLSAIQYCKSQKITNPSDIKAKILETLGINLFDSDKTVPMVADNNYGVMAYQRNSKPISIETFVKDHLKLDIKSEPGKTVLDRLSQVDQANLNKISAKDFKGFNNKTLDGVASMLETVGVQIRTQAEINVKNNSPRAKAEKEKRAVRTAAAENIALAYDNAINVIKNYQGNQGWMNVAFYRGKLGQLLDKVNPTDVATCFDAVIKRLEKEKQFTVSRLKTASANESEFKQAFKNLTGKDYNENAVKNFLAQAQKGGDWSKSYDQAFGDKVVKRATDKVNFQQYVDGAGDIVLMLLGTEAIGKGVAWAGGKVATKLAPYVPKVLSNLGAKGIMTIGNSTVTVGRVAGSMVTSAATFTAWDATKNYINLKTKDIQYTGEDAVKEWQAYKEGNVESGKFGAFAGLLNSTVVGKVVNGTMKLFEKPVAKALQGVTKTLEKGEVSGADVMKTFMAKQTPGMIAQTAGAVAEVAGFTMYETANEITKELLQTDSSGQRHLPKDLTEEGLTNYLWKHLKGQAANLGEIKAISKLLFMHKGAIAERDKMMSENLAKCEMLSKVKVQKAKVNGREIYEVTMPNGNRKVAHSPEEIVAYCNNLMLMDMAANSKTTAAEAKPNSTKGINTEDNALIDKTKTEKVDKPATSILRGESKQDVVRTTEAKEAYVKPEVKEVSFELSEDIMASDVVEETNTLKANTILDKVFNETTIPKSKAVLEEMGFTKEEISSIDLKDSTKQRAIEAINNALKYTPELKAELDKAEIFDLLNASKEEIEGFLSDTAKWFTDENCELLTKHVIFDDGGKLNDIFRDYNNPQVVIDLLPTLTQNGKHKVLGSQLQFLGYYLDNPNNVAKITPKNVDFMYKINDKIEDKKYTLELYDILNIENVSPNFADNYVKEANRFAKFGLKNFEGNDLQERISKRKAVSDFLEEYPIDVTTYDYINKQNAKLSGYDVYQLSQHSNKAEVQKFVNSLTKEARTQFLGCADFVDKGFTAERLANLLNEAAKNDFGEIQGGMYKLLNGMIETGSKDYDGMLDLIMSYKGTSCLSWDSNEKYVQVANGDFKGAAKYIELAKELKMNPEHYKDLISDKNADFKMVEECLTYVKGNKIDLYDYSSYDRELLTNKNWKDSLEKYKYANDFMDKFDLDMPDFMVSNLIKNDLTLKDINELYEFLQTDEWFNKRPNMRFRLLSETSHSTLDFAKKLTTANTIQKDFIASIIFKTNKDNLKLAEKLCADKDFPKEHIVQILGVTNKDNLALSEKLCADRIFPTEYIADIIFVTNKDNRESAEALCTNNQVPKDLVVNILGITNQDNQVLSETLCTNENVPKDKIYEILKATVINDPNDAGGNNGKTDAKKVDRYTHLFQNPNTAMWASNMLKQGFDIETISKLAPTKQSFFTESVKLTETTQKIVKQKAVSPLDVAKQETIQEFENLGLDTKQANAIFKSIAKNGVVDTNLKAKAIELINKGVAKNKIGDILNSAQITGEFNSKIVDNFVLLQNRGLNPLLEKNLAVLNNISGADCAVKFNSKVRNQMKAMINNLPDAVKISLKEQEIEIDSILKKLEAQIVRTSANIPAKVKVESGFRSKAKITGFERIVVDKYEPTEQVWRNEEATKNWAEEKYLAFKNREYVSTRNTAEDSQLGEKVTQKRKEVLKAWYGFMETDENIKNNPFVKVILCDYITKELEPERSTIPPSLNKDVVKQILGEATNSSNFSFSNAYAKKMKELSAKNSNGQQVEVNGRKGTWYTVPKTDSSSPDFKANAAKIRAFSDGTNWCIRTWNAEPYVQKGAMHFFVDENGLTQICIREQNVPGSVYEIQKRQQDQTAPVAYLDVIQSYMKEHELKPQDHCQKELDKAIAQKPEYDKLKSELDVLNSKKDYKGILEKMGITVTVLPDGTFELSHYISYINKIALNDFGINENELLANVSKIKGNANFKDSNATTLPNLSEVGGKLDFGYANISNIKNLKSINGQEVKWQ